MNPAHEINTLQSSGYCTACGTIHKLEGTTAIPYCKELMSTLDRNGRIDLETATDNADPALSTDYLFGPARGQMFSVMVYLDEDRRQHTARAFSGQYNGRWKVAGWVPPIIDSHEFLRLTDKTEREIKRIGREMDFFPKGSDDHKTLDPQKKRIIPILNARNTRHIPNSQLSE